MFFGHAANMLQPGGRRTWANGWETKRRPRAGHDWAIVRLGRREPSGGSSWTRPLQGQRARQLFREAIAAADDAALAGGNWTSLLAQSKLQPHTRHVFEREVAGVADATHVRLNIFPDGGVARLRLFGSVIAPAR